jgi:hypothetical protein
MDGSFGNRSENHRRQSEIKHESIGRFYKFSPNKAENTCHPPEDDNHKYGDNSADNIHLQKDHQVLERLTFTPIGSRV